jgi:catechol 2,3-dioxygenase-like lactoylglutathione lyase family enzyme
LADWQLATPESGTWRSMSLSSGNFALSMNSKLHRTPTPNSGRTKLDVNDAILNLNQVTLPAIDVMASVAFYRRMGFRQIVDSPHYARFECPDGDSTFSVHQVNSIAPDSGVVIYFESKSLDDEVRRLQAAGVVFDQTPRDERWLWREARLRDPSGNTICIFWAGNNRKNPPWRIETAK